MYLKISVNYHTHTHIYIKKLERFANIFLAQQSTKLIVIIMETEDDVMAEYPTIDQV